MMAGSFCFSLEVRGRRRLRQVDPEHFRFDRMPEHARGTQPRQVSQKLLALDAVPLDATAG